MILLQTIIPIVTGDVQPIPEGFGKAMFAALLIMSSIAILSMLVELYRTWRNGKHPELLDLLFCDDGIRTFIHVAVVIVWLLVLLAWLSVKLSKFL